MAKSYWLMKSEPDAFSFATLAASKNQTTTWDGVRNYQARNMLRDEMKVGDQVLFYHSRSTPPHIAGLAEVVREGYPDPSAFDTKSHYFDAKSDPTAPRWFMVDVKAIRPFAPAISLDSLKENPALSTMAVVQKGQRLSVQPVSAGEFKEVLRMEKAAFNAGVTDMLTPSMPAKKSPATKATAKKSPAKKSPAKKSPAKKR